MKKPFILLFAAAAMLFAGGCSKYDDTSLRIRVGDLENRVEVLEELCKQMNTNILALQSIVNALQQNDYVTGVAPITKNGETIGYTISFTKSAPITIYHGSNGADGADGKDGHAPIIGVRQDTDGIYYWTLDGDWLLDNSGNKVKAEGSDGQNGTDGKDGIAPQLKIENGYWYVSYGNGSTWTNLGKATGEDGKDGQNGTDGNSFFQSITQDEENVYFTLADGSQIVLPKEADFGLSFEKTAIALSEGETVVVHYTIVGATASTIVKAIAQDGWSATVSQESEASGSISITASVPMTESEILVLASDGKERTVMYVLDCVESKITAVNDRISVSAEGGSVTATIRTNTTDYEVVIADNAKSWLRYMQTRTIENQELHFTVAANELSTRTGIVTLVSPSNRTLQTIAFTQQGTAPTTITMEREGSLSEIVASMDCENVKQLKISGAFNEADAALIKDAFPALVELDLSESRIFALPTKCFYGSKIQKILLPQTLTVIREETFRGSAITKIEIPENVNTIERNAFAECRNLHSAYIASSVERIGGAAFLNCSKLSEVNFGDNSKLTTIENIEVPLFWDEEYSVRYFRGAFEACGLKTITIPASVKTIASATFYNCKSLENLLFEHDSALENFGQSDEHRGSDGICQNCSLLKTITIPASCKIIGPYAFTNCKSLESVIFEPNCHLEIIGDPEGSNFLNHGYSFQDCIALKSITIPASVSEIGGFSFYGCSALTNVVFEENSELKKIHEHAFIGCPITKIRIPEQVVFIGEGAFARCKDLAEADLSSAETKAISQEVFSDCTKLQVVKLPNNLTEIEDFAFSDCSSLKEICIPSNVRSLGEGAFSNCSSLGQVIFPSNLRTIGSAAFKDCSALQSIEFEQESALISINGSFDDHSYGAFAYCYALQSVDMSNCLQLNSIGMTAFYQCGSLTSVKIGMATPPACQVNDTYTSPFWSIASSAVLQVPVGSRSAYREQAAWNVFGSIIETDF